MIFALSLPFTDTLPFFQCAKRQTVCILFLLILFAFAPAASAQQTPPPAPPRQTALPDNIIDDDDDVVRVDTDLVHVDVSVTDASGQPVRNLRPTDFKLYEDGTERPVSFFGVERRSGAERPIAVVFALDVSGSMSAEEIERLRGAVNLFTRRLVRGPSVFAVMGFGMRVKIHQSFTNDLSKLDRAFDKLARDPAGGLSTHTYDAVDDAVRLLVRSAPRTRERRSMKRVVLVITDGFPVGDTVAPQTVIERANAADTSIYTVTLPSYTRLLSSAQNKNPLPTPLDVSGLVERTGGRNVYATERDFEPLFRELAEEVTSAYVLAFYPSEEKRRDGRFHAIRVAVPAGLNARQSRPGYQSVNSRK
ncbi:MAG: VWA domain-containing protein [Acidobacteriota bacterium]|nr:VWA domain-containing protein [Acidobacteriota bacterium]